MATVAPLNLPPSEAIAWFRAKGYKIGFDWRDVWKEEHRRAFTVAKAMRQDLLADIRSELDKALAEGRTLADFRRDLTPTLQQKGWWGRKAITDPKTGKIGKVPLGSPRRLRTIFDTNIKQAYNAGAWKRFQQNKERRPFLKYQAVRDDRTRDQHAAWHGVIRPVDDPFWQTHTPMNGWGCRCWLVSTTEREMKRRGEKITEAPPVSTRPWLNTRTSETLQVPVGIDPGFDYNPGGGRTLAVNKAARASRAKLKKATEAELPEAVPVLTEAAALHKRIGDKPGGSIRGGIYKGKDGVDRIVKFYDDPAQAYGEAAANRIYDRLGLAVPESVLVRMKDGKLALATTKISIKGQLGLEPTKAQAKQVLKGFVADVLTGNWDAVGQSGDNIVIGPRGKLFRIDQGGTLLFRAKAGRKKKTEANWADEWLTFPDPGKAPAYAKLFRAAGIDNADDIQTVGSQIDAVKRLRDTTNDFSSLFSALEGVPEADRKAMVKALQARAKRLVKAQAGIKQRRKLNEHARSLKAAMPPGSYDNTLTAVKRTRGYWNARRKGLTEGELVTIRLYTQEGPYAWTYKSINDGGIALATALRGRGKEVQKERTRLGDLTTLLDAGLAKLPTQSGTFARGTTLPQADFRKIKVGGTWTDQGYISTSSGSGFGGQHRFSITAKSGRMVTSLSAYPGEKEVLVPRGTKFKVEDIRQVSNGQVNVVLREE